MGRPQRQGLQTQQTILGQGRVERRKYPTPRTEYDHIQDLIILDRRRFIYQKTQNWKKINLFAFHFAFYQFYSFLNYFLLIILSALGGPIDVSGNIVIIDDSYIL